MMFDGNVILCHYYALLRRTNLRLLLRRLTSPRQVRGIVLKHWKIMKNMHKYASMKKTSIVFHCNPLWWHTHTHETPASPALSSCHRCCNPGNAKKAASAPQNAEGNGKKKDKTAKENRIWGWWVGPARKWMNMDEHGRKLTDNNE